MKIQYNNLMRGAFGLLGAATANLASAQGTMTYAPDPNLPVPTLSGGLLVVLGILFGVIAFRVMRSRNMGTPLAVLVAMAVTGTGVATGARLIADTEAAAMLIGLSVPGGSIVPLDNYDAAYRNTTAVPQRIIAINPDPSCTPGSSFWSPPCTVGLLLGPLGSPTDTCGYNQGCPPP